MTTTATDPGAISVTAHAVSSYTLHEGRGQSRVLVYGDEVLLGSAHFEAARDRNGEDTLSALLDNPNGPLRRGPWPAGVDRVLAGSAAWDERRVAALQAAAQLPDPDARRIAAAKVRELHGVHSSAASRTLATYGETR